MSNSAEPVYVYNARIDSTSLTIEDHGILTFWIMLSWNGGGQGLGGFALDGHDKATGGRKGWPAGLIAIRKILEVVGVAKWEDLKGKLVRVKVAGVGCSRPPIIGNIIDEKWFDMKTFAEVNQ